MIATFDQCVVDLDRVEIRRAGDVVAVQPQVFDVIEYLIERRERVVTKEELLDNVWGDRFVSESALTSRIKSARRALGDDGAAQRVIKTVHGRGYRFVADLEPDTDESSAPAMPSAAQSVTPSVTTVGSTHDPAWPTVGRRADLHDLVERAADDEWRGVVITGPDRSGKSTMLDAAVRELVERGRSTLTVRAAGGSPDVPLSALTHLLPDGLVAPEAPSGLPHDLARTALWQRARAALVDRAGPDRPVIVVDDADRLDSFSAALLLSLATTGDICVAATVRAGAGRDGLLRLVDDGHAMLVELAPLDEADIDALLYRRLGGPIEPDTLRSMVELSGGIPGILVDVVETSLASGGLGRDAGVWRLTGPAATAGSRAWPPPGLSDEATAGAERLALIGALTVDQADALIGSAALDELDAALLVALGLSDAPGGAATIRIADPLLARKIVDSMPPLRARRHRADLTDAVAGTSISPPVMAAMIGWGAETVAKIDPAVRADAAITALLAGDLAAAEVIAASVDAIDHPLVAVVDAEIAVGRGQHELADQLLAGIEVGGLGDVAEALALRRRASIDFVHQRRHESTVSWLEDQVTDRAGSGDVERSLHARLMSLFAAVHRYDEILEVRDRFGPLDGHLGIEVDTATGWALVGQGRFDEAKMLLDALEPKLAEVPAPWASEASDSVYVLGCSLLQQIGQLDLAAQIARRHLPLGRLTRLGFFPAIAADIELSAGRARSAREILRPARSAWLRQSYPQFTAVVEVTAARSELMLGHLGPAASHLDAAEVAMEGSTGAALSRVVTWVADCRTQLGLACDDLPLDELADRSAARRALLSEMEIRMAAVAVDPTPATAERLLDRIESVAGTFDGELWPIRIEQVRARAEGRSLQPIAEAFRALGYHRFADDAVKLGR